MEFRTSCRRSVKLDAFLVGSGRDHRCADDDQASGGEYCLDMLHTSPPCRTGARIYRWGRIVNPVTGRELTQSVSTDRAYFTYAVSLYGKDSFGSNLPIAGRGREGLESARLSRRVSRRRRAALTAPTPARHESIDSRSYRRR